MNDEPELPDTLAEWIRRNYPSVDDVHRFLDGATGPEVFRAIEVGPASPNRAGWLVHVPPFSPRGRSLLHECGDCSTFVAWPILPADRRRRRAAPLLDGLRREWAP